MTNGGIYGIIVALIGLAWRHGGRIIGGSAARAEDGHTMDTQCKATRRGGDKQQVRQIIQRVKLVAVLILALVTTCGDGAQRPGHCGRWSYARCGACPALQTYHSHDAPLAGRGCRRRSRGMADAFTCSATPATESVTAQNDIYGEGGTTGCRSERPLGRDGACPALQLHHSPDAPLTGRGCWRRKRRLWAAPPHVAALAMGSGRRLRLLIAIIVTDGAATPVASSGHAGAVSFPCRLGSGSVNRYCEWPHAWDGACPALQLYPTIVVPQLERHGWWWKRVSWAAPPQNAAFASGAIVGHGHHLAWDRAQPAGAPARGKSSRDVVDCWHPAQCNPNHGRRRCDLEAFIAGLATDVACAAYMLMADPFSTDSSNITIRLRPIFAARRVARARVPAARGVPYNDMGVRYVSDIVANSQHFASLDELRAFARGMDMRNCINAVILLDHMASKRRPDRFVARGQHVQGDDPDARTPTTLRRHQQISINPNRDGRDRVVIHHRDPSKDGDRDRLDKDWNAPPPSSPPSSPHPPININGYGSDERRDIVSYDEQRKGVEEGSSGKVTCRVRRSAQRNLSMRMSIQPSIRTTNESGAGGKEDPNTTYCDITICDAGCAGGDGGDGLRDGWMHGGRGNGEPGNDDAPTSLPNPPRTYICTARGHTEGGDERRQDMSMQVARRHMPSSIRSETSNETKGHLSNTVNAKRTGGGTRRRHRGEVSPCPRRVTCDIEVMSCRNGGYGMARMDPPGHGRDGSNGTPTTPKTPPHRHPHGRRRGAQSCF